VENNIEANNKDKNLVLIVEDNQDMREYIHKQLIESYQVIEATDGLSALKLAKKWVPDLIVSDIMMPAMNGYELCEAIKSDIHTSHIPLVLLSSKSEHLDMIKGFKTEADDYLTKPFNPQILKVRLENLLTKQEKLKNHYLELTTKQTTYNTQNMEEAFIAKLKQFILTKITDADIQNTDLALTMNVSERQLHRKLKALTGKTPGQWLLSIRLNHAAQMLKSTQLSITQVVAESGFNSSSYFTKKFKQTYQKTPSEYRTKV